MDLLYSGNVEGFAIVSSDSDFTPLATRLRESGKRVIGVGQRKTPKAFVEACEKFVFLEVLGGEAPAATEQTKDDQPRPIQSVLTKALNKVDTDDDDWASLGALGNHLNRTDPSFDARTYGFAKLSDLVKAQPFVETKTVTGAGGRGQLWVRLKRRRADDRGPCQEGRQGGEEDHAEGREEVSGLRRWRVVRVRDRGVVPAGGGARLGHR